MTIRGDSVLLVEDNAELRGAIRDLFEYDNVKVCEAMHGGYAVDLLRGEHDVALIFLDLNMPVMNGHQFLTAAKKEGLLKDIKVVVFATTISDDIEAEYLTLKKPTEVQKLLQLGREYCKAGLPKGEF